jgi:hypothetical protein
MNSTPYPLFCAVGSHRELGRQHGEQAAEQIRGFLEYLAASMGLSRESMRSRASKFQPLFEKVCPHLLEEVHGLAEGAKVSPADALVVQLRGELAQLPEGACTTFVVSGRGTAHGETLIGQTSDTPPELMQFAYVLDLQPVDRPQLLMWTFGGMLGYHGINRHEVGHFANALGGGPAWSFALSHYPLKRMILEQRTLDDVVSLMRRVRVCSNGNYVLCDGEDRILDVELTSAGPNALNETGDGYFAHANHFLCSPHACPENHAKSLPDSFRRQDRVTELISAKFGSLTVEDFKAILSDHDGRPTSICRHSHDGPKPGHSMLDHRGQTVAAIVAEPARGRMHVSRGNPCENEFVEYSMRER